MFVRTTLRLKENLKKDAQKRALDENTTLQEVFNRALETYLDKEARKKAKKIIFKTHDFGVPFDNLTRSDYYPDPKLNDY